MGKDTTDDSIYWSPVSPDWKPPKFPELAPVEVIKEIPWLSMDDDPTPFDNTPYQAELTPLDVPPFPQIESHIPTIGFGGGTGVGRRDQVTNLTVKQELKLLANNNVFMSTKQIRRDDKSGLGAMSAYVIREDAIEPAHEVAVRIKKVNLVAANVGREGTVSYSYSAFESNLQKHLVSDTKLSAGIPKLFKADAAFGYASAGAAREQTVNIHFAATEWVAQGRIKIREDDITLDDSFVQKVKAVCESKGWPAKKANDLMNVLDDYGHFVPTDIIVGGRITLTEDTQLTD
jgi:hypothetical protein